MIQKSCWADPRRQHIYSWVFPLSSDTYYIAIYNSYKCVRMSGSKRWKGLKEEDQNMPFCSLKSHILPGQFRGKAQPAHCQFMTNQLAALNNGTQKPFAGQCSPPLKVYNTSLVSLCCSSLAPALHVSYVPDGELSAVHTDTHVHSCMTQSTSRGTNLCATSVSLGTCPSW